MYAIIVIGCDFVAMKEKIQTTETQAILNLLQETFSKILNNYNSLIFAIKDNAGVETLQIAEEQLKSKNIDISNFPNRDRLQFYIKHYVQDIPTVKRLREYVDKNEYPRMEKGKEHFKEGILEARSGLNQAELLLRESEDGIQEILTEWAFLQFIINHPERVSIATIKQLIQYGYQGTCGTPMMKEIYYLVNQIYQLKKENTDLKNQLENIHNDSYTK